MSPRRSALLAVLAFAVTAPAAATEPLPVPPKPVKLGVAELAAHIDQLVAAKWQARGVQPAPLADDATFLRRVYLDLAGRIPSITRARDFLDDPRPNKRRLWVDELLDHPEHRVFHVGHFANVWRGWLLAQANSEQAPYFALALEAWLVKRLHENVTYDQLVKELLTANVGGSYQAGPSAFYQAHELKVEEVAASTSRLFLGVTLECAQCHNHPFARWTRQQFWEYTAFFSTLPRQGRTNPPADRPAEITIPGTDRTVKARFLDGSEPALVSVRDARVALADWMTAPDNPYFARAVANRLWAYFFGTGLIEPVDEPSDDNPPSHPELLDELARQLVLHQFDLKYLLRAITASRTYQLSGATTHPDQNDPRLFARAAVRGLTAEQLFDSLAEATGYPQEPVRPQGRNFGDLGGNTPRFEFVTRFTSPEKRTEAQMSILQALFLMNGKFITDATSLERNKTLSTIADSRSDTGRRIDELYLVTLSRKPRPEERSRLVAYVDKGGVNGDSRKALADVFWALLNSAEFMLNH